MRVGRFGRAGRAATADVPTCISRIPHELPREALNGSASRDRARHEKDGRSRIWSKQGAVAVVDEREKERDRHTPWLHREVQGRVAGPLVQLRFISLIPCSGANQR